MKFPPMLVLLSTLLVQTVHAERPKIGLALSGGGAKAGAHIGVLRVLEKQRVPIDYIAGTSAGAIIGALYATGLNPDEIELAIAGIDWDDMLDDRPARPDLPFRRKRDGYNYLVDYRPGYNDGDITLPMGFVGGQEVLRFFRRHLGNVSGDVDFDDLPIPLRVVATDLASGEAVIIGSGDLAVAVTASMAVPFVVTPVALHGRMLVDGGPSNNLPIDVVREMGADIIIAVDITAPLLRDEQLDSAIAVAYQMTNLLTQRTVQDQLAGLNDSDVLIRPDLADFQELDFTKTLEPVPLGEQAASAAGPALMRLALDEDSYRARLSRRAALRASAAPIIRRIEIHNASSLDTGIIRNRLDLEVGDALDVARIDRAVRDIYGLDLFERVDYSIEPLTSGVVLYVDVVPKSWGPNYLQFGLRLSEDFSQGSAFNIGIAYLSTALNSLGAEWRVQMDLGERQGISVDWYQPLSVRSRWFVEAEALMTRRNFRFFEQDQALAELRVEGWGGRLSGGAELGRWGEFRLGWNRLTGDADVAIGVLQLPDDSLEIGEYFATIRADRLDDLNFPRDGIAGGIGAYWSRPSAGADASFEQLTGALYAARSWGDYAILASLEGGTTLDDDAPLQSQFLLGGLGRLSGYPVARFAGQHYGLASVTAFRRTRRSLWVPMYTGISIEAGNTWQRSNEISSSDLRLAGAAYAGADTPIGPIYLALGLAQGGNRTVYLYLGNPFVSQGARPLD